MASDGLFFVAIFLLFFGLWLFGGGPTKPISFAGPYITPVTNVGVTQNGYGNQINEGSLNVTARISSPADVQRSLTNAYNSLGQLQQQASQLALFGDPSPYKGMVVINRGDFSATSTTEYVTLYATRDAPSTGISISGWRLVSAASGYSATIGEGTALPRSGDVNPTAPIILYPGDTAMVLTRDSPIGVSFRLNECIGYFATYQTFYPSLPRQCPTALNEFNAHYTANKLTDDSCYNLMRSTGTCEVPNDQLRQSNACFAIIDNYLNYNGCVANHQTDPGFAGHTWYVYLHQTRALWKQSREAIRLVDQNGKTVDLYEY